MRNLPVCYLSVFTLLFTMFCAAPAYSADNSKPLVLVGSTWPPYVDKKAPQQGAAMDLVKQIFLRAGYPISTRIESWPRTLEGAKIGIYDVVATAWINSERQKTLAFSDPYFENVIRFVKRKDSNIQFSDYHELKGLVVGTINGYAYGEKFLSSPGLIRVPKNHLIQNLLLLKQGRIDLALGDQWVIRNELTEYFPTAIKDFQFVGKPVSRRNLYIAVSRKLPNYTKIVADFNKTLKLMKADGSLKKIIKKHQKNLIRLTETPL